LRICMVGTVSGIDMASSDIEEGTTKHSLR